MATNTNIPLATYTVSGSNIDGPTGVTFTLPSGYTDIVIKSNIKSTAPAIILARFNGDVSTNYSTTSLGNGPGTTRSSNAADMYFSAYAHTTTNWNTHTYNIMNYSNSTHRKTILMRNDNSTYGVDITAGTWNKAPEPITSVRIYLDRAENFVVGSTWTVYGIAAEPISPKATGGTIYSDAEYFYHLFGNTGAFVPSQSLTADILVVAGGGGGQELGGGAGAGGLLEFASQSLSATSYTVTVGAGGAGGYNGTGTVGGQGVNSQFGALTASVGGGGGGRYDVNGGSGGSGGGGGRGSTSGGANTTGQGSAGGGGNGSYAAGGGGGAGGAGQSAPSGSQAGNGGIGVTSTLIQKIGLAINAGHLVNGTYYYAGGGGGGVQNYPGYGVGGYGGGGRGGSDAATPSRGTNGMANTGGGAGGGSGANNYGGNGGSGVVIVRYLK